MTHERLALDARMIGGKGGPDVRAGYDKDVGKTTSGKGMTCDDDT
jgi:hypothetical protein